MAFQDTAAFFLFDFNIVRHVMALPPIPSPTPSAMTYFCIRADVETLWSAADVLASVDDDSSGALSAAEESLIDDAITRAATQMLSYLAHRHDALSLVGNAWCRQINAAIAAYLLATRRGDPAPSQIAELHSQALADLESVRTGALSIPDAPTSLAQLPRLINFTPVLGGDPIIQARNEFGW